MNLDKNVLVFSDDPCTAIWNSKEYELGTEPVEVKRGIAEHWLGLHPDIRIEEISAEVIEQRTPVNPLEQNNRGAAFADLKKGKEEDEETLAIRAKAKELGIKNSHNMKITKLQALIDEAAKAQEQKTGDQ
jgi:hypothetical protein